MSVYLACIQRNSDLELVSGRSKQLFGILKRCIHDEGANSFDTIASQVVELKPGIHRRVSRVDYITRSHVLAMQRRKWTYLVILVDIMVKYVNSWGVTAANEHPQTLPLLRPNANMAASTSRAESPVLDEEIDSIPYHTTYAARLLPVSTWSMAA
jgi:hypothetical protein